MNYTSSVRPLVKYLLPILCGLLMLPIPLLRDFHFESAMLVAVIGCFWAALSAAKLHSNSDFFNALKILGYGYLLGLPLLIFSVLTGCLSVDAVGFWIFIPVPSIFLGQALGRLLRLLNLPYPRLLSVVTLVIISAGIWMLEFFTLPQVYFFNHVWGLWPGPIFDESVTLSYGFLFFRWITGLWIILLWILPNWAKDTQHKLITAFTTLALLLSYMNLNEMGIISPRDHLKSTLSQHIETEHFQFYFDPEAYTPDEVRYWSLKHEFHFQQITEILDIDWPEGRRIESYLYRDAWQKKKLVGAKFTSYVPIWLEQDQLHIAKQQLAPVLKHELVHVISKQFGNRLFNGSWSIGMIEGIAEAIAADASSQSTLEQIIAAEPPYPGAEEMRRAFSNTGFYGAASSISYTTAGAFVEFLLKNYPVENFKSAYADLSFEDEDAYGVPFDTLVTAWKKTLPPVVIDSVDQQVSEFIFGQRSLFQRQCPHSVSPALKLWDQFLFREANNDTLGALNAITRLHELDSSNLLVKRERATMMMLTGESDDVIQQIMAPDSAVTLQLLKADALVLSNRLDEANQLLSDLKPSIERSPARNYRYSLALREDSLQWTHHVNRRYRNELPDMEVFRALNSANKALSVSKALELQQYDQLIPYTFELLNVSVHEDWFDIYESLLEQLVFIGEYELAQDFSEKLSGLELRARYQQRLNETLEWKNYLQESHFVN